MGGGILSMVGISGFVVFVVDPICMPNPVDELDFLASIGKMPKILFPANYFIFFFF